MTWELDSARSEIAFSVKHMMVSTVRGHFERFATEQLHFDPQSLTQSRVTLRIDVSSFTTGSESRDEYVRGPEFLDARHFPHLIFTSRDATLRGDTCALNGELRIKLIARPIQLKGRVEGGKRHGGARPTFHFTLEGELNREDFGLTWAPAVEAGGLLVSKNVKVVVRAVVVER